jgi:alkanesulfonate monooxygenase SsuD/methylene tetrahydromethanopterin reductase-like flavin-dependent oxidoreductase (luciferase family)
MSLPKRPGMTIPLPGPLHAQRDRIVELADLGYTDVWTAESDGGDGLTPLALASAWEPRLRLGTAILPAYTRAPALMAQSAATMADAAPGRFVLGIGSSSNVIVEQWNGIPFEEPYKKVRDLVRFLRDAFTGREGHPGVRHLRDRRVPARDTPRTDPTDRGGRPARGDADDGRT